MKRRPELRNFGALLALLTLPVSFACSGDSGGASEGGGAAEAARATEGASAADPHACDVLTTDFVQATFGASGIDAEGRPRSAETYTSCTLVWPSDVTVEREVAGRTVEVGGENRITLSISVVEPGSGPSVYDTGVRTLQDRYEGTPVDGLGDEAVWFPDMDQVTVRAGDHVFHLAVTYLDGEGTDLEKATKMARAVIQEVR